MFDTIVITYYFIAIITGLLSGLYIGLSIRSFFMERAENREHKIIVKEMRGKRKRLRKELKLETKQAAKMMKKQQKIDRKEERERLALMKKEHTKKNLLTQKESLETECVSSVKTRKNFGIKKDKQKNQVKSKNLLQERIPEYESYTEFVCDSIGDNPASDYIKHAQHTQDGKYTLFERE